jgi:hypothetical protein
MGKTSHKIIPIGRTFLISCFFFIFAMHAQAQTLDLLSSEDKNSNKKDRPAEYKLYVETGFEYSDNVFRLTDSQISKLEANNSEDSISGRFKGMDSVSDVIIKPSAGFKLNSSSPLGGKFRLTSSVTYNYFLKNDKSSYPEGKLRLSNSIGKNDNLIMEGNFLSGFFKRNYLSGVNDLNDNGNIPRNERIYSSATYDEYEGMVAFEHVIIKKKHKKISGLEVEPFIGFHNRKYNSVFNNRDQKIVFGGLEAALEIAAKFELAMTYQYEKVTSPDKEELVLFDEVASGIDANGDGARKKNAPLITRVDRSSGRYTIEIKPSYALSENSNVFLEYKRRITDYTSGNKLDVEHYHIDATRQQFRFGGIYKFSKAWSAEAEYCRTDDDNDEDGNYFQNNFLIKIKYNIL